MHFAIVFPMSPNFLELGIQFGKKQGASKNHLHKVLDLFTCMIVCAVALEYQSASSASEHVAREAHHREAAADEADEASLTDEADAL